MMIGRIIRSISSYRTRRKLSVLVGRGLSIGNNVQIEGEFFIDPSHCHLITIEDNCVLAPGVRIIAHDASMYSHLGVTKVQLVRIGANCFLGDSVCVLPGVSIGPDAVVGAGSVVTRSIPPRSVAAGSPARVLCRLDEYLERHREASRRARIFPEDRYRQGVIDRERMDEMRACLAADGVAYMQGSTPDVTRFLTKPRPGRTHGTGQGEGGVEARSGS